MILNKNRLRIRYFAGFLFLAMIIIFPNYSYGQNILYTNNVNSAINKEVEISICIDNAKEFVAFQTDLKLPESMQIVENSAYLTERANGHSLSISMLQENTIRILAFSLNQAKFQSNSGAVLKFKLNVGSVAGSYTLTLSNSIISDEHSSNILTYSVNGNLVVSSDEQSIDIEYSSGWNLISIPRSYNDMDKCKIFNEDCGLAAYGFDGGYFSVDRFETGKGYWMKFNNSNTKSYIGDRININSAAVKKGWNLVGPFSENVYVSSITTTPSNIITSDFFSFQQGYVSATTLEAGKGYWIKVSNDGMLNVNAGGRIAKNVMFDRVQSKEIITELLITDRSNYQKKVFLVNEEIISDFSELPPLPPEGIFDVRFSNDKSICTYNSNIKLMLQGVEYPVKIKANGKKIRITDLFNGEFVDKQLDDTDELIIDNPSINQLYIKNIESIEGYSLEQNYPNPFNPTTKIKYSIPNVETWHATSTKVLLKVFDLLGRLVAVIVNKEQAAGYYSVNFDAHNLPSGIYIYKLTAGNFVKSRKMLLLK